MNRPSRPQMPEDLAARLRDARARRTMQGERRVITMLFCDVVDSTLLAEQFDPEEWAEIMNEAFGLMIAPIYTYEGTVARLMGDGLLAFFGAPIAHEDDPQRAILAGLDIVASMRLFGQEIERDYGVSFQVRVGINTGPVVVGEIGSDLALEYTAMGDAINLAARMEATAVPGTVQITEHTYRLVAPLFDVWELGQIDLKGKVEPVRAYRVLAPLDQPGRLRGIQGIETPLVGRAVELDALRRAAERAQQGQGQIVFLVGEAGLGKSRLVEEMHRWWMAQTGDAANWGQMGAVSYGAAQPYGMIKHQIRQVAGIRETDPADVVRAKLDQICTDYPNPLQSQARQMYAILLGVAEQSDARPEGEAFRRELLALQRRSLELMVGKRPGAYVVDDLHWGDPASTAVIESLFPLVELLPILFLCAMRPERETPGWDARLKAAADHPDRFTEITLKPLTDEDSSTLVNSLLAISDLPTQLHRLILRKTEGNPFFIEEVVRSLIDSGAIIRDADGLHWRTTADISQIDIPGNVQALLMARIDRLEQEAKRTLQLAAVIGRSFYIRVLRQISETTAALDNHLSGLEQLELVREMTREPEWEYVFRHALTHEAAYRTILRRQRRRFHRRVGEAFENLFPDRLGEEAHRLAYHFQEAGDLTRAQRFYTMAGDTAVSLYANAEAVEHYGRALDIARELDATSKQLIYLFTRLGRALELCHRYDDALVIYRDLEELGRARGDQQMALAALIPQVTVRAVPSSRYDPSEGAEMAEGALNLARVLKDPRAEARVLWNLMLLSDSPAQAVSYGEQSLAIARQYDLREEMAFALHDLSRSYITTGQIDEAMAARAEAETLWRELGNKTLLADNLGSGADLYAIVGNLTAALELGQEALRINRQIGSLWGQAYNLATLGAIYAEIGRLGEGIVALEEAVQLAREARFVGSRIRALILLTWFYDSVGQFERAHEHLSSLHEEMDGEVDDARLFFLMLQAHLHMRQEDETAVAATLAQLPDEEEEATFPELREYGWFYYLLLGEIHLAQGDAERALAAAEAGLAMMVMGLRPFRPYLLNLKAAALDALDQPKAAVALLQEAQEIAESTGIKRSLWPALALLGDVQARLGQTEEAADLRRRAAAIVRALADSLHDPDLRTTFLAQPTVAAVLTGDDD